MNTDTISLDATRKQQTLDDAMERARKRLRIETLADRNSDRLDFHDIAVASIRDLVRSAFEAGYAEGLATGYRQALGDVAYRQAGLDDRTSPRNPELAN